MAQLLSREQVSKDLFKKHGTARAGQGFGSSKFADVEKRIAKDIKGGVTATVTAGWVIAELTDVHKLSTDEAGKKGASLYKKVNKTIKGKAAPTPAKKVTAEGKKK